MTATPWGFRDILPEEAQAREEIALTVKGCFREHHYLPVETPLLEDKGSLEEGGRIADTPFKLFDDDGRLLVVRPDNTLPIVRLVSTRMRAADLPMRLRYEAPVVRERQRNAGGSRQFTQLGFELIGAGDTAGDVEIVSLVAEAVRKLALPGARIIAGSVRPFKELLAVCEDRELAAEALRCVHANDFVGLDARVAASVESDAVKAAVSELPRLHGGAEVLDRVDALLEAAGIVAPLTRELRALVDGLAPEDAQVLSFDFSIMNSFDYYTGLVFKAYAGGLPDPVGSGGRYDSIFTGAFGDGIEVPAAGFAFSLERLEAARTSAEDAASDGDHAAGRGAEGPLRIAVPKGSLKADTLDVLETAGWTSLSCVIPVVTSSCAAATRVPTRVRSAISSLSSCAPAMRPPLWAVAVPIAASAAGTRSSRQTSTCCSWSIWATVCALLLRRSPRGAPARPSATMPAAGRFAWPPSTRASRAPGMPSAA